MKTLWRLFLPLVGMMAVLVSCKDDNLKESGRYNPDLPVKVTDFEPKSGPAKTRLYIYGENFGSDPENIFVRIGGVDTKVIGSDGKIIYCIVPQRANEGTIEVAVGDTVNYVKAGEKFNYEKKTMVETLAGYVDDKGEREVKDGPFSDCGFEGPRFLMMDPKDVTKLYLIDTFTSIRLLDMETDSVSSLIQRGQGNWDCIRGIGFTAYGDSMIVANEQDIDNAIALSVMSRSNKFTKPQPIAYGRRNNCCAAHPVNGEIYYCGIRQSQVWRYDPEAKESRLLFSLKNADTSFWIYIHPSGDYAYITFPSYGYIMKTEYDKENKTFKTPYIYIGNEDRRGFEDGNGTSAQVKSPYQGVFVKNEKYVNEGRKDVYDYYFCDGDNHCIRKIDPDGNVELYAGRGSKGANSNPNGYIDGDLTQEARFYQPRGIAYDSRNKIFYVADTKNYRIRKIQVDE